MSKAIDQLRDGLESLKFLPALKADPVIVQVVADYDALAARLAAVEAECADLIAGKEYQAMQRTLGEVNARLAEVERELEYAYRVVSNGFVFGSFDFSVLRGRAALFVEAKDGPADSAGDAP